MSLIRWYWVLAYIAQKEDKYNQNKIIDKNIKIKNTRNFIIKLKKI